MYQSECEKTYILKLSIGKYISKGTVSIVYLIYMLYTKGNKSEKEVHYE